MNPRDEAKTARARRRGCAALATLLFGAASPAWADPSFAVLYGQLHLSLDLVAPRAPDRDPPSSTHLSSNASRFGLRGAEYLGRGMLMSWQIETSVSADSGGGQIAGRETFLALEGDFGRVKVGNFLTPYDDVLPIFGNVPTLTTSILSTAALWSQSGVPKSNGGFDRRMPNSVRYDSPEFVDGLQASVQYALGEEARDVGVLGASVTYVNGPLEAGFAYEFNRKVRGSAFDDHAFTTTASWNFGPARVAGVYERLRYDTFDGKLTRDFFGGSVTAPVGAGALYAFVGRAREGRGTAQVRVGGLTAGPDSGAWQYTLSYSHSLSPRTILYAGFVGLDNARNASYTFAVNPYAEDSPTGLKLRGLVLGAIHLF